MITAPHRKHCQRYNIAGHAHYLTFSCYRRQRFLARERSCRWLLAGLGAALERHDVALWAWVFMPEHVHLLVAPRREQYSISRLLAGLKLPVTRRALAWVRAEAPAFLTRMVDCQPNGRVAHRFWQRGGGYDRNIYRAREIHEKIDYIHRNPVRRGLVADPTEWYWSSAADHAGLRPPLLAIPFASIPWRR